MHGGSAGGYTAQAIGLEYTTASRGAFTGTFTVLAVPILVRPTYLLQCLSCNVALFTWLPTTLSPGMPMAISTDFFPSIGISA